MQMHSLDFSNRQFSREHIQEMDFPVIFSSVGYRWPEIFLTFLFFLTIIWYLHFKNQVLARLPILGELPYVLKNLHRLHEWYTELIAVIGNSYMFRGPIFGDQKLFFTCDHRNVEYILKTNFSNFPKGKKFLEAFDLLGQGIINVDFELWHQQRKMATKAFGANAFRKLNADMSLKVVEDALLPLLVHFSAKAASVIDLQDVFMRYAFDTNCTVILGRNPESLSISFPFNEFFEALNTARAATFYRNIMPITLWKMLRFLRIGIERKMVLASKTIYQYISHQILSTREDLSKGLDLSHLLAVYMKLHEVQIGMSAKGDKFLRETILNLFFPARDTVSSGLTWFFWLISKTPRVEAKILEELNDLFMKKVKNNNNQKPKWLYVFDIEDLKELVYLHASLYESMRIYPPVPLNRKGVLREDMLPDGNVIQPGMDVIFSTYAMGRMKSIWGEDCLEFKPERWIDGEGNLIPEFKFKYSVFNIGPRICIGKDIALTQMKLVAAATVFNFHVHVLEGQSETPKWSTSFHLQNGMMATVKGRAY